MRGIPSGSQHAKQTRAFQQGQLLPSCAVRAVMPILARQHNTKNSEIDQSVVQLALEALGSELSPQAASMVSELVASQQGRPPPGRRRAFVPSPAQLKALPLQYGQNTIDFTFAGQRLRAYIHFFNWNSR